MVVSQEKIEDNRMEDNRIIDTEMVGHRIEEDIMGHGRVMGQNRTLDTVQNTSGSMLIETRQNIIFQYIKELSFVANSDFLIPISLQFNVRGLRYFKL